MKSSINITDKFADVKSDIKRLNWVMVGVVVVTIGLVLTLVFALGGMLTSNMAEKQASYEDLKDQVTTQNAKIDALTQAVNTLSSKSTPATLPATQ